MRGLVIPRNICEHAANLCVYLLLNGEEKGTLWVAQGKNDEDKALFLMPWSAFFLLVVPVLRIGLVSKGFMFKKKKTKGFFSHQETKTHSHI